MQFDHPELDITPFALGVEPFIRLGLKYFPWKQNKIVWSFQLLWRKQSL